MSDEIRGDFSSCVGMTISHVALVRGYGDHRDDEFVLTFAGKVKLSFQDRGQNCCEERYMTCEDVLCGLSGSKFLGADVRQSVSGERGEECHEIMFLVIHTSGGDITISTHNEHNGYYGGIDVTARVSRP